MSVYIEKEYAKIDVKELNDPSKVVEQFDEGHKSVMIEEDGKFKGFFEINLFRENFFKSGIPTVTMSIEYYEDEATNENLAKEIFKQTFMKELPLVKDGVVKAVAINDTTLASEYKLNETQFPPLYWDLISEDMLKRVFNGKKILISSDKGSLKGFRERVEKFAEVETFNVTNYFKHQNKYYDFFLYGADAFRLIGGGGIELSARYLYAELLSIEVFMYLQMNGVDFYFVDVIMPQEKLQGRGKTLEGIGKATSMQSEYKDYLIMKDSKVDDGIKIIGNQRVTTDQPTNYHNQIYFYGPCTAFGAFATEDKTIESYLQRKLNENKFKYRVVNCGTPGSWYALNNDLNELYLIMDSKYNSGDKVLLIGATLFKNFIKLPANNYISFTEIFTKPPADEVKCFQYGDDMIHYDHIDEEGNYHVANAIYERLKMTLKQSKTVEPFFNRIKREVKVDEELEKYIKELKKEKVDCENIGAVVMNCNPFTKGHMYLIEKALSQVEFLYVFVVEEDLSEFSFKDRFAIVKANCERFANVKVLPSGKYMISSFTFEEYFKKDEMQAESIMPAKDVRLFGKVIAPTLNIKTRFVGEEPLDNVTRQYNEAMKSILTEYNVKLVEVPRVKLDSGEVINATKVRRLLKEGMFSECRQYLTEETYKYIIDTNLFKR